MYSLQMNCVTCLKIGKKYPSIYVNKLYNAIRKQCDLDFICFTDDPSGIDPDVIVYDMQPWVKDPSKWQDPDKMKVGIQSWWPAWNKLELFAREELDKYDKKIFFDLDVIIQGDITPILDFETNFALTPCKWKSPEWVKRNHTDRVPAFSFNSDCVVWKDIKYIYEQYTRSIIDYYGDEMPGWKKHVRMYKGIDPYLNQNHFSDLEFLPDVFYSYREGSKPEHYWENNMIPYLKFQPEYAICSFHQDPAVHELDPDHVLYKIWNEAVY